MAAQPWSREASTYLIDLYSGYPCLYDITSKDYHNRYKRQFALEGIAKMMWTIRPNVTASDVQSKINGLRTQFLAALNKVRDSKKSGCSRDDVYVPTLWCFKQLKFLEPHTVHHKGQSNLSMGSEETHEEHANEESQNNRFDDTFESMLDDYRDDEDDTKPVQSTQETSSKKPNSANKGKKRKIPSPSTNVDALLVNASDALKSIASKKSGPPQEDEWDLFGRFVGSELRKMTIRGNQKKLKRSIQIAILDAYEEEP